MNLSRIYHVFTMYLSFYPHLGGTQSESGIGLALTLADQVGSQLSDLDGLHLGLLANALATSQLRAEGTLQGTVRRTVTPTPSHCNPNPIAL